MHREHPAGTDVQPSVVDHAALSAVPEPTDPQEELAICLQPMLDRLPDKYRQVILLTEYQGMTQTAAAAVLGMSVSGTKTRMQRARRHLKQVLTDCCHIELDRRSTVTGFQPRHDHCAGCG